MSKGKAILLGLATLVPVVHMVVTMVVMMGIIAYSALADPEALESTPIDLIFGLVFAFHFLSIFLVFGLLIVYIIHLFHSDRVPQDKRALWAVVLFLGNVFAMPVYWYIYIRPRDATPPAPS